MTPSSGEVQRSGPRMTSTISSLGNLANAVVCAGDGLILQLEDAVRRWIQELVTPCRRHMLK